MISVSPSSVTGHICMVFDFVEKHGRFIVGSSPSVGATGGWMMNGGHGPLSPSYVLGTLPSFISLNYQRNHT
jgi:hypothetical protein